MHNFTPTHILTNFLPKRCNLGMCFIFLMSNDIKYCIYTSDDFCLNSEYSFIDIDKNKLISGLIADVNFGVPKHINISDVKLYT